MRGRGGIVAVALLGLVGCGPPRQTSMHVLDVGAVAHSLAFAPDGRTLACALRDRILLVDAENGTRIRELGPLPEHYRLLAFSGARLLSAGTDGYVRLWDVTRGTETGRVASGRVCNLAISPDGRWLVTTAAHPTGSWPDDGEETITIWDLQRDSRSPPIAGSQGHPESLAVSADGLVAVGRYGRTIDIFDLRTGRLLRSLRHESPSATRSVSLSFSPDSPHLLASGDNFGCISLWDAAEGRWLVHFSAHMGDLFGPSPRITAMSFAARGLLAAGGSPGVVGLWRLRERLEREPRFVAKLDDYSTLERLNTVAAAVEALVVNRDESLIATSYDDSKVRIWSGLGSR